MSRPAAAALLALALGCAPETRPPVKMVVLGFVPDRLRYEPSIVAVTTLRDLVGMKGDVATFVGGAQLVIDPKDPTLLSATTEDEIRRAVTKSAGGDVAVNVASRDEVYYPSDFHSLNIATAYYNYERSFLFYQDLGLTLAQVTPPLTTFYFPELLGADRKRMLDNAAYFPLMQSFLVLPQDQLQQIPLPMNLGILGHEYTHAVFDLRVHNRRQLKLLSDWSVLGGSAPGANLLTSIDEGIADLMGTGITCGSSFDQCDPRFIAASIESIEAERDLDGVHCFDQQTYDLMIQLPLEVWKSSPNLYKVGTIFASSVWKGARAGVAPPARPPASNVRAVMQAAFSVMATASDTKPGLKELVVKAGAYQYQSNFRLDADPAGGVSYGVLDAYIMQLGDPKLQSSVCSAFYDRFGFTRTEIPTCPATAQRYRDCP